MKKIITDYLVSQCDTDEQLKATFNPDQVDDCIKYIEDMAQDQADKNEEDRSCVAIQDEIVFRWAKDFFKLGKAQVEAERQKQAEEERKRREEENRIRKEEEEKKKAEEKERQAKEKAEKEFQESQHANGQVSLLDFC